MRYVIITSVKKQQGNSCEGYGLEVYDPENIRLFHNLSYFCFGSKLFSSFVICLCFYFNRR